MIALNFSWINQAYRWLVPNGWGPVDAGWFLTILILFGVEFLAFQSGCATETCDKNKLAMFLESDPNEIGDTLAGLFSALAFVWIIVTVFLQSHELREQRKEFQAQRKATEDMARAMAAQAKVFEDEQKRRDEARAKDLLDEKLQAVWNKISTYPLNEVSWAADENYYTDVEEVVDIPLFQAPNDDYFDELESGIPLAEQERIIRLLARSLEEAFSELGSIEGVGCLGHKPDKPYELQSLIRELEKIQELSPRLDEAQRQRCENLMLKEIRKTLQNISQQSTWWSDLDSEEST